MNKGFTLAEVLITFAILGIIATIAIPTILNQSDDKAFSVGSDVFEKKMIEVICQMNSKGKFSGYASTEDFSKDFVKFMKFTKNCGTNLDNCFVEKINIQNETVNLSDMATGESLGQERNSTGNVGLGLSDGTNMIIAFRPNCAPQKPTLKYGRINTTCLGIVYDLNGRNKPNEFGKDIRAFNAVLPTNF